MSIEDVTKLKKLKL